MKEPIFAGLLNLIPGLAYLYLGVRRTFAAILLTSTLFMVLDLFLDTNADTYASIPLTPWAIIAMVLSSLAFVVDAYLIGRQMRADFKKANKLK